MQTTKQGDSDSGGRFGRRFIIITMLEQTNTHATTPLLSKNFGVQLSIE